MLSEPAWEGGRGLLEKRGYKNRSWQLRWFALHEQCLFYYKPSSRWIAGFRDGSVANITEEDAVNQGLLEPRGCIPLQHCKVREIRPKDEDRRSCFKVTTDARLRADVQGGGFRRFLGAGRARLVARGGEMEYVLHATSDEEAGLWVGRIIANSEVHVDIDQELTAVPPELLRFRVLPPAAWNTPDDEGGGEQGEWIYSASSSPFYEIEVTVPRGWDVVLRSDADFADVSENEIKSHSWGTKVKLVLALLTCAF